MSSTFRQLHLWVTLVPISITSLQAPECDDGAPAPTTLEWLSDRSGPWCDHGMIHDIATDQRGTLVVAAGRRGRSSDGWLQIHDAATGARLTALASHNGNHGSFDSVALAPQGDLLATVDNAGELILWSIKRVDGKPARVSLEEKWNRRLEPGADVLAFSPDGSTLVAGLEGGEVMVLDPIKAGLLATLAGHESSVVALAFSPSGDRLATGDSQDGVVVVWSTRTFEPIATLTMPDDRVNDLAFISQARLWVSYGWNLQSTPFAPEPETAREKARVCEWDICDGKIRSSFAIDSSGTLSMDVDQGENLALLGYFRGDPERPAAIVRNLVAGQVVGSVTWRWGAAQVRWLNPAKKLILLAYSRDVEVWETKGPLESHRVWQGSFNWWRDPDIATTRTDRHSSP